MGKFYITTPLYYVNAEPHIGHAYTTILADCIARFARIRGLDTHFLTGTDEHGQKIADVAASLGVEPIVHCDRIVKRFKSLWKKLDISYDDFIRTTEKRHIKVVKKVLQTLYDNGDIYKSEYEGWYCVPDERFWMEKDLTDGKCPLCGRDVVKIKEANYFFRMSRYQHRLVEHIESHPDFILPSYRRNEVLGFLKKPLGDLCISRPKKRLSWGIELPFDPEYVAYVWVDALTNYISAVGFTADNEMFNRWWPADYHLIGKDILTTHSIYWTTLLAALGIELPKHILAHGWWLVGESKMGKSLGNAVNPEFLVEKLGKDPLRYFLLRKMAVGQDAEFTLEAVASCVNSELANNIGNLVSRVLSMVHSFLGGKLEKVEITHPGAKALIEKAASTVDSVSEKVERNKLHLAIADVMALSTSANQLIEMTAPWKLAKNGDTQTLKQIFWAVAITIEKIAKLLYPVIPSSSADVLKAFGVKADVTMDNLKNMDALPERVTVEKPFVLFPRVDINNLFPEEKKMEKGEIIDIEFFKKLDMRVAEVKSAERVSGTDKLLRLTIDVGEKMRTIVAGIATYRTPEEMVGKKIIVVYNLKPARIRGILSEGMLLAASDKNDNFSLLTVDKDIPAGTKIC